MDNPFLNSEKKKDYLIVSIGSITFDALQVLWEKYDHIFIMESTEKLLYDPQFQVLKEGIYHVKQGKFYRITNRRYLDQQKLLIENFAYNTPSCILL